MPTRVPAPGDADAQRMCELVAKACSRKLVDEVTAEQALVMSTGVIGRFLPMDKVEAGIELAADALAGGEAAFLDASDGILTTDAGRKVTSRSCSVAGRDIHIAGMAKGAGMIGPNMATMLCCILTDAPLTAEQSNACSVRQRTNRSTTLASKGTPVLTTPCC